MNDEKTPRREFYESDFNPWEIPCLECGSLPMEGTEETAFMLHCSNAKCGLHIVAVQPWMWPTTRDAAYAALRREEQK